MGILYTFLIFFLISKICLAAPDPNFYIFICFGQSNMEGHGPIEQVDLEDISERYQVLAAVDCPVEERTKWNWYKAVPPLCRSFTDLSPADYFGRHLIEKLPSNKKVGIINIAIGGTRIILYDEDKCADYIKTFTEQWQINTAKQYDNNPYRLLINTAKEAQKVGVIKGFLLHQGESDTGDQEWPNNVKIIYDRMLNELNLKAEETPLLAGEVVTQKMGGCCWQHNPIINTLPNVIPNAHVISAEDLEHQGDRAHFTSEAYRIFGRRYAEKMLTLLPKDDDDKGSSNKGVIAAVVIIVILVLGGAGFFIYWKFFKNKNNANLDTVGKYELTS